MAERKSRGSGAGSDGAATGSSASAGPLGAKRRKKPTSKVIDVGDKPDDAEDPKDSEKDGDEDQDGEAEGDGEGVDTDLASVPPAVIDTEEAADEDH
jgi:hypothetical protein